MNAARFLGVLIASRCDCRYASSGDLRESSQPVMLHKTSRSRSAHASAWASDSFDRQSPVDVDALFDDVDGDLDDAEAAAGIGKR